MNDQLGDSSLMSCFATHLASLEIPRNYAAVRARRHDVRGCVRRESDRRALRRRWHQINKLDRLDTLTRVVGVERIDQLGGASTIELSDAHDANATGCPAHDDQLIIWTHTQRRDAAIECESRVRVFEFG